MALTDDVVPKQGAPLAGARQNRAATRAAPITGRTLEEPLDNSDIYDDNYLVLTQTSELAVRALMLLGLEGGTRPVPPRRLAERLDCSPTYLAKTLGLLVKAGVLRSVKGAKGGVHLARTPEDTTLLAIVEGTQGLLISTYCRAISGPHDKVCGFHHVMEKLHRGMVATLSEATLADLMRRPTAAGARTDRARCRMHFSGCEAYDSDGTARQLQGPVAARSDAT